MTDPPSGCSPSYLGPSLATAVLALAGLAFHLTPWAERLNLAALDASFRILRGIGPTPAPDDIVIVGLDAGPDAGAAIDPGLKKLPDALVRVARGRPRAVALDAMIPPRSLDAALPGYDDALATALVISQAASPLVIGMSVDASREVVPIAEPFLRGVDPRALAFALLPRDHDGSVRQAVVALPTRQGNWPTLAGWLCEVLSGRCEEGRIDYALGPDYTRISLSQLLDYRDDESLSAMFRDRVVFIAKVENVQDQLPLPAPLAGWDGRPGDSPAILAHAQTLRTLLHGRTIGDAPLPLVVLVVAASALLLLVPRKSAVLCAAVAVLAVMGGALVALRAGTFFPPASPVLTLVLAPLLRRWFR